MSLAAYVLRAAAALIVMCVCAVVLVKYYRKHNINLNGSRDVEVLSSLRLTARDIFFVVRCGPEVIAFTVSPSGTSLMGRWNYHEWLEENHHD